ncbi:MAG: hypothetical protein U5K54_29875 [Cytophagales bacterium]|nr:hypothetical protein [Cytophagales bacterium]
MVLTFDEALAKSLSSVNSFSISPAALITSVSFTSISLREINLKLNKSLAERQLYIYYD